MSSCSSLLRVRLILSLRAVPELPDVTIRVGECRAVPAPFQFLRWDKVDKCVHSEWKAFANSDEFRAALMRALEAIKDTHAIAYLSDTRNVKVIVHGDQNWVNEVWVPLLIAAGVKRFALVKAESGLGKLNVEDVINMVDNRGLQMRGFDSVQNARMWLAEATPG